jgi:hypothetical protein
VEGEGLPEQDLAAVRDAEDILRRSQDDERDALAARARYQAEGLPRIEADTDLAHRLRVDESVVDVHSWAVVNRQPIEAGGEIFPGRLYLTTRRLMLLGQRHLELELDAIDEIALAGERLLVTLRDASGLTIEAARPRFLRVQIAAALTAVRA